MAYHFHNSICLIVFLEYNFSSLWKQTSDKKSNGFFKNMSLLTTRCMWSLGKLTCKRSVSLYVTKSTPHPLPTAAMTTMGNFQSCIWFFLTNMFIAINCLMTLSPAALYPTKQASSVEDFKRLLTLTFSGNVANEYNFILGRMLKDTKVKLTSYLP